MQEKKAETPLSFSLQENTESGSQALSPTTEELYKVKLATKIKISRVVLAVVFVIAFGLVGLFVLLENSRKQQFSFNQEIDKHLINIEKNQNTISRQRLTSYTSKPFPSSTPNLESIKIPQNNTVEKVILNDGIFVYEYNG